MKKIACVGYHDTGASVIDDIFRECDNVAQGADEGEIRILHDIDGVSDLEYHLVIDPHRLGAGISIKRFIAYAKRLEKLSQKSVGKEWMNIVYRYVESLKDFDFHGYCEWELPYMNNWYWKKKIYWLRKAFNHFMPSSIRHPYWYNYFPNHVTHYAKLNENDFIKKTKIFVEELCKNINTDNLEYVMLDQFVSSHNPGKAMRYIDDIKVIVVDRDPRDIYIHDVKLLKEHVLPANPRDFALQYRKMRILTGEDDKDNVLRVKFEDMIYKYDEYLDVVFNFVGIDRRKHHINPCLFFNPAKSINGTQLWKKYPQYLNEIKIIEKEIPDLLYKFPEDDNLTIALDGLFKDLKEKETYLSKDKYYLGH